MLHYTYYLLCDAEVRVVISESSALVMAGYRNAEKQLSCFPDTALVTWLARYMYMLRPFCSASWGTATSTFVYSFYV